MRRSTRAAATPPASPVPTAPTNPKPGATKRQRKAVPLGNVTNLLLPETPTPIKPRRTARRPPPSDASAVSSTCSSSASATPALNTSSSASATLTAAEPSSSAPVTPAPQVSSSATATAAPEPFSTAAVTPAPEPSSAALFTPAPKPSSTASVTPAPKPSFAAVLDEEGDVFESPTICTVYARRRTTEAVAERRSSRTITSKGKEPVVGAAASCPPLGKSTKNIRKKNTQTISLSAPGREAKKKQKRPLVGTPKLPEEFVKKQKAYFADVDAFELAEEEVSESELE